MLIHTEVEVNLDQFEDEDLIDELKDRGRLTQLTDSSKELLETIYQKRRLGKDYQTELDTLIFNVLGKLI